MDDDYTVTLARWNIEKRENGYYVVERLGVSDRSTVYGPMPEAMTLPLIAELKQIVQRVSHEAPEQTSHLGRTP